MTDTGLKFLLQCPGMYAKTPAKLWMYPNGKISKDLTFPDICLPHNIKLSVAFNNEPGKFEVDSKSNSMVKYPPSIVKGPLSNIPYDWEILDRFFKNHKITPSWINCNYTWGTYIASKGQWNGAVGQVSHILCTVCR